LLDGIASYFPSRFERDSVTSAINPHTVSTILRAG